MATQYDFYDQNLLVGMHFRYKRMGAVAWACRRQLHRGVPPLHPARRVGGHLCHRGPDEGRLICGGRHGVPDTHGQSETVFAFTHLLGIQLMPRIRNWKSLHFYRPNKGYALQAISTGFSARR